MIRLKNFRVRTRLLSQVGVFLFGIVCFGILSLATIQKVKVNGPIYKQIVQGKDLIADILPPPEYIIELNLVDRQLLSEMEAGADRAALDRLISKGQSLIADFEKRHDFWKNDLPESRLKDVMLVDAYNPAVDYFSLRESEFIPAILRGDIKRAKELSNGSLREKYEIHRAAIDEVVTMSVERNQVDEKSAAAELNSSIAFLSIIAAAVILLALAYGWALSKSILTPLNKTVSVVEAMAQGDIDQNVAYESKDELGGLSVSIDSMSASMRKVALIANNVAAGDLSGQVDIRSPKDKLNISINTIIDSLRGLVSETEALSNFAVNGELAARGNAGNFNGSYRDIVKGVNATLDAILRPVTEAANCLEKIAQGDLSDGMTGNYKGDHAIIKNAINGTLGALNDTLGQINSTAVQVSSGASQVSASSQALSHGATESASSLEEITSSMTEITSQTRQNAENATAANQLSASARQAAEEGNEKMKKMLDAMTEINSSSNQISKIIKAIDEIAFQTNLLALNAAVEAARAGIHGKGFAVVAEEVRNLAQRSAKAAKETTELIEGSVKRVENGTSIANETAKALEQIVIGITRVTDLVGEIASASNEQSQGIEQINQGLSQIDQVTQTNTANAEESASAAEELSSQGDQLTRMLLRFRLNEGKLQQSPSKAPEYDYKAPQYSTTSKAGWR
jgi:methyl-accepting chemotaxis protein